jgi:hypothetical protein
MASIRRVKPILDIKARRRIIEGKNARDCPYEWHIGDDLSGDSSTRIHTLSNHEQAEEATQNQEVTRESQTAHVSNQGQAEKVGENQQVSLGFSGCSTKIYTGGEPQESDNMSPAVEDTENLPEKDEPHDNQEEWEEEI